MDVVLILNSLIFNNSINQGSSELTVMWNVTNSKSLVVTRSIFLKSSELWTLGKVQIKYYTFGIYTWCKFILYFWNLVDFLLFLGMAILDTTYNFYGTNMENIFTLACSCAVYFSFNMNYHTICATPIMTLTYELIYMKMYCTDSLSILTWLETTERESSTYFSVSTFILSFLCDVAKWDSPPLHSYGNLDNSPHMAKAIHFQTCKCSNGGQK